MDTDNKEKESGRREVTSRNTQWARVFARWLNANNITPNQISVMSIVFSTIGGGVLLYSAINSTVSLYASFVVYIICIQLRLLCNLFDGMVAIEGGKKSYNGDLYNDMPDRISDVLLIVPVGYVCGGIGVELAWLAALLAVMTAYFRWIGVCKTNLHFFNGPMAKQHRMALLTFTAVLGLITIQSGYYHWVFLISLALMNIGLIVTLIRRLYFIAKLPK